MFTEVATTPQAQLENLETLTRGTFGPLKQTPRRSSRIKPLQARPGVTYINLSPLDESSPSDEENVSQSMKSLIDFGDVGNVLNKASPFLGPVGGPLAGMAGTAFDKAGKID